ncbi:unnamed protein product [Ceutorhynchus assimilis]|uniref:Protein NATD1 n=1 Tax=Ceutorhynchus assimilis TaxID=467358 RepID=A0A9N9QRP6_9CUCU|nr:unnamed protein product [Ceutorhynchus assimilis]
MQKFRGLMSAIKRNLQTNPIVETNSQLTIQLEKGAEAYVAFEKVDENTYNLVHTEIPEQYQGQGLGRELAKRIFDHLIVQRSLKLQLSCEFLQRFYFQTLPTYKGHVIEDFTID